MIKTMLILIVINNYKKDNDKNDSHCSRSSSSSSAVAVEVNMNMKIKNKSMMYEKGIFLITIPGFSKDITVS